MSFYFNQFSLTSFDIKHLYVKIISMSAIKSFFIKYKKQIKQILLLLVICIVCSLIVFGILCAFNVITFNNGLQFNVSLFESLKNHRYGYVIFFFFQVIVFYNFKDLFY